MVSISIDQYDFRRPHLLNFSHVFPFIDFTNPSLHSMEQREYERFKINEKKEKKNFPIDISMLDYDYVSQCNDVSVPKEVVELLSSGRERCYPRSKKTVGRKTICLKGREKNGWLLVNWKSKSKRRPLDIGLVWWFARSNTIFFYNSIKRKVQIKSILEEIIDVIVFFTSLTLWW